jgi:hypothetical protein
MRYALTDVWKHFQRALHVGAKPWRMDEHHVLDGQGSMAQTKRLGGRQKVISKIWSDKNKCLREGHL